MTEHRRSPGRGDGALACCRIARRSLCPWAAATRVCWAREQISKQVGNMVNATLVRAAAVKPGTDR